MQYASDLTFACSQVFAWRLLLGHCCLTARERHPLGPVLIFCRVRSVWTLHLQGLSRALQGERQNGVCL